MLSDFDQSNCESLQFILKGASSAPDAQVVPITELHAMVCQRCDEPDVSASLSNNALTAQQRADADICHIAFSICDTQLDAMPVGEFESVQLVAMYEDAEIMIEGHYRALAPQEISQQVSQKKSLDADLSSPFFNTPQQAYYLFDFEQPHSMQARMMLQLAKICDLKAKNASISLECAADQWVCDEAATFAKNFDRS